MMRKKIFIVCQLGLFAVLLYGFFHLDLPSRSTIQNERIQAMDGQDLQRLANAVTEMVREAQLSRRDLQRLREELEALKRSAMFRIHTNAVEGQRESQFETLHLEVVALKEMLSGLSDVMAKYNRVGRTANATVSIDGDQKSPLSNNTMKILCYLPITDARVNSTVSPILETWGKRCDKLLFFAHSTHPGLPIIALTEQETGKYDLSRKMFAAMYHVYKNFLDYDWYLKADTDTYIVMENLRKMLVEYDPSEAIYFGHALQNGPKEWMSGGAGYVLSREALRRFGVQGHRQKCLPVSGAEDVAVGRCMTVLGVTHGDSRDELGRSRFHCLNPLDQVMGNFPWWMFRFSKYPPGKGVMNISETAISFHNITGWGHYMLDYFIYNLHH